MTNATLSGASRGTGPGSTSNLPRQRPCCGKSVRRWPTSKTHGSSSAPNGPTATRRAFPGLTSNGTCTWPEPRQEPRPANHSASSLPPKLHDLDAGRSVRSVDDARAAAQGAPGAGPGGGPLLPAEPFPSDRHRVEYLFALYEKLTAPLVAAAKPARKGRKAGVKDSFLPKTAGR